MKKIIIVLTIFALASCSKSEVKAGETPLENVKPPTEVVTPLSFKISPKNGRIGGFGNYQAGEIVDYEVIITDEDKTTGITYELSPEGQDQTKHQILNTDYIFGDVNLSQTATTSPSSLLLNSKNSNLKFKILRPGTFTLKYNLQKLVSGIKVGNTISQDVLFSSVRFFAYSNYGNVNTTVTNCFGVRQSTRWDRDFFFTVDCGDQIGDNYLFDPNFNYTYSTDWCGKGTTGNLGGKGANNKFSESLRAGGGGCSTGPFSEISYNGHNGYTIDQINVNQKSNNGSINNVISYKNVIITAEYDNL